VTNKFSPWVNIAMSLILVAGFAGWIWGLIPIEPWSSPIQLVDKPFGSADPAQLPAPQYSEDRVVRLVFAGDVMQHRLQAESNFSECYAEIGPVLENAHVATANLEFPVNPKRPVGPEIGSVEFNGSPEHVQALIDAGFNTLVTANNHAFDQGEQGFYSTLEVIKGLGGTAAGTARKASELNRPEFPESKGLRVGISAYTYSLNSVRGNTDQFTHPPRDLAIEVPNFGEWEGPWRTLGQETFARDVSRAREAGVDFLIAICHWGKEWHFQPNADQRQAAHDLIDAGYDLVVGSHSHVLQGSELYRGKLISYGLGNLNSDFRPWQTRTGALLEVDILPGEIPPLVDFRYYPTFIETEGHKVTFLNPKDEETGDRLLARKLANRVLGPAAIGGQVPAN
jgi:poly-gamma-glutamate synthesis protein (capsule biosynthesis protein)